eukprot:548770_1
MTAIQESFISNYKWLNKKQFPCLKIVSMINITISPGQLNSVMNSLTLSSLKVHSIFCPQIQTNTPLKISSDLEFIELVFYRVPQLDLSGCDKLIGMTLKDSVPFCNIKWSEQHLLTFVNVKDYNGDRSKDWFNAYKKQKISSHILIGHSFFLTEAKANRIRCANGVVRNKYIENDIDTSEKYLRRRSMEFDQIVEFIANSNFPEQRGWEKMYKQCFNVNEARFVDYMPQNIVPWSYTYRNL